ncbi:hypothetical protein AMJ39_00110 [candidate division TA06 bacterium DG_24]|uniref:UPF0235 protein AMJ71_03795 n=3 Tax=Bacteria division TA06 TaxID=1156500 RepID=A0A0S8JNL0_UNCT6|nr:MAG: hypothetical protein AMJ39_00110 [candidate division TA06 bacterium DG_24]KPK69852.1 MAG: hypothetical protein AMJ82_04580 [candidate division TA06 bacterium SM23_40]KPL10238.1 MAG: hypothetical protein AMJ71_03795 [candidate division TA06 bacterium SM1_40]
MRVRVRLQPRASRDEIVGWSDDGSLRVRVTSAPERGKANLQLLRLLAATLGMSRGRLRIVAGERSREKVIDIDGDEGEVLAALSGAQRGGSR